MHSILALVVVAVNISREIVPSLDGHSRLVEGLRVVSPEGERGSMAVVRRPLERRSGRASDV